MAAVETAVVLSAVLVVFLGVLEYGRIVMLRQVLNNAAREGARLAVVGTASQPETTTQDIINQVNHFLAGQSLENLAVTVYHADPDSAANLGSWDQAGYGEALAVKIEGDYRPVLPTTLGILPDPFRLTAISMLRSEAN